MCVFPALTHTRMHTGARPQTRRRQACFPSLTPHHRGNRLSMWRWGVQRHRELPLLIKQHIGRLMHPPAPRPPPSFSSLYIFFKKAESRFLSHALRIPPESPSLVSVVAPKRQLASLPAPPSLPALSLSPCVRVSHPWPLPPSSTGSPIVARSSSLSTARASFHSTGTANHMISLSCLLWEMVGCHGDSRLHLCRCVSERRFRQEIDDAV